MGYANWDVIQGARLWRRELPRSDDLSLGLRGPAAGRHRLTLCESRVRSVVLAFYVSSEGLTACFCRDAGCSAGEALSGSGSGLRNPSPACTARSCSSSSWWLSCWSSSSKCYSSSSTRCCSSRLCSSSSLRVREALSGSGSGLRNPTPACTARSCSSSCC
jgi:hypothetical protein